MYINKQLKQTIDSNGNTDPEHINTNSIKLRISSSSKKYPKINYTLLPKLNESEKKITKRNNGYLDIEDNTNTDYKEELNVITTLWDELGVTEDYRYQFNQIIDSNIYNPKIIFIQEKENLQKFKTSLMKLKKEIINRENNIENLIKIIRMIDNQKELNQNILKDVINIIKNLRLNAVNIVIYINRVRELGFYYYFQGKWDLTKIKNEYTYNNNYLLQMNEDLNFLKKSYISNYIEMGNGKIDAFLTNCSQLNKENINNDKIIIPIQDDLIQLIEQSIFFVTQDQIMDNIYQKKSLAINKNNNINGMNRSNSTKIKIKKVPSRPMTSKGIFNNNKYREIGGQNKMKNINNIFNDLENKYFKNGNNLEYNNLFQLSTKLNEPKINLIPESTRIKNRVRNQDGINGYNNSAQKRIKIEHEILGSLNASNGKNITNYDKNRNDSNEKIKIENEKLKKDNQVIKNELQKLSKKIEENEKFKKRLEDKLILQKKEMDYNSNSVEEIKIQLLKEKKEIEQKLKEEIEKTIKIKKQGENNIINKEIQLQIDKSKYINNIKYSNIYKKHSLQKNKIKYKIEYYKGDIDSLINKLKINITNDNIDLQIKQLFNIENKIYNKYEYLIGQYPKILISKLNEDINKIIGICSFYYNNSLNEKGILIINFIVTIKEKENSFEQINDIIKFIKENESYNMMIINLNYLKEINSLVVFLKNNFGFYSDNNKNKLIYINNKDKYKFNNNYKGSIKTSTISLISFIKKENINNNDYLDYNYKFMNNLLVHILLLNQKKYKIEFDKITNKYEINLNYLTKEKNNIISLLLPENERIEELNSKINDINIINKIKDSLNFKNNQKIESFSFIKIDLNIFFKNILYMKYNNYYYNRISSENVDIIKDNKNSCIIYNIPSLNEDINILILELNETIKNILINNNSNIYELFYNYYKTLNEIQTNKTINIAIPFFKIDNHLQTQKLSNNLNNIEILENKNKNNIISIGSLDEYLEIEFNKDTILNINDQINYILDNKDIIINQEFIFGITKNDKNNNDFSLIQLNYIKKEYWININDIKN